MHHYVWPRRGGLRGYDALATLCEKANTMSSFLQARDADQFGIAALSFVERVGRLTTSNAVHDCFKTAMADFGFDYFIMVDLPKHMPTSVAKVLMSHAPIGWMDRYVSKGYQQIDPVLDQCRRGSQPFEWRNVLPPPRKRIKAAQFMNEARDFGLGEGLTIPIHNFDGTSSCVSLSASNPYLNQFTKPAIHLMALYAFEQIRQMTSVDRAAKPELTARELEVLTWAAAGKSAATIANILNISERTAIAHTINATHKLGASNKTHAVALAVRRRLIDF